MQNYQELMRDIEARMQTLGPRDVCALFLLSVESREAGRTLDMTESAERAASLLSPLFPHHGHRRLSGREPLRRLPHRQPHRQRLSGKRAATLSEALWFANEQTPAESIESYVGVYVSPRLRRRVQGHLPQGGLRPGDGAQGRQPPLLHLHHAGHGAGLLPRRPRDRSPRRCCAAISTRACA